MKYRFFPSKRLSAELENEKTAKGALSFVASTDSPDRYGDVIEQRGWELDSYRANPVVLFGHDHNSLPIGKGDIRMGPEGLIIDVEFDMADPRAAEIAGKAQRGFLNAVSVGFTPLKALSRANLPIEHYAYSDEGGSYFEQAELLEVSIVTIPANADATSIAAKSLDNETKDFIRQHIDSYLAAINTKDLKPVLKQEGLEIPAPEGYHWMDYEGGPVLMEGDAADHDGALPSFEFEIIEEHDPSRIKGEKVSEEDDEMKAKEEEEEDEKDLSYHDEDSEEDKDLERHALIKALLLFKGV